MTRPLYEMFNTVPRHYDILNTLMTLGLDKKWRSRAAQACLASSPGRILDICCGTGDLAHSLSFIKDNNTKIFGLDYSRLMLDIAVQKNEPLKDKPLLIIGDASRLPFQDESFDCVGISFAFRNLTYRNPKVSDHLAEIFRIIKPDGRFVIVESSQPKSSLIRKLFHIYLRVYVAKIGALISGEKGAYNYLAESARHFYTPEEIVDMLKTIGFSRVDYKPLFFGAAGIHTAVK
ncbi:MAG: ubiquinone/menaquinone biosynthesis methyltransferase [Dehalococcoidales bacterium]|nr:ubiquinone/menaquinone biosynthesis methyltransferase [Dehalococcoidales bacterium]